MDNAKARENKLKQLAERQGLTLEKSTEDDPGASGYGKYRIVAPGTNTTDTSGDAAEFSMDLGAVEQWLTNDEQTPQAETVSKPDESRKASKDSDTHIEQKRP